MCKASAYLKTLYRRLTPEALDFWVSEGRRLSDAGNDDQAAIMKKLVDYACVGPLSLYFLVFRSILVTRT